MPSFLDKSQAFVLKVSRFALRSMLEFLSNVEFSSSCIINFFVTIYQTVEQIYQAVRLLCI